DRVRTSGADRFVPPVLDGNVHKAVGAGGVKRTARTAKPCGPDRRCYGQALANAAVASTGAGAGEFRWGEGGQKELGSRESAA
ncbi:hypothetical protein, partial [Bradyrhizobium japonicum]|uniref:hypothetical protein n=2 Tax=Bradyrhizobium japonicum TaxID=375 RepID=UPI001AEC556C